MTVAPMAELYSLASPTRSSAAPSWKPGTTAPTRSSTPPASASPGRRAANVDELYLRALAGSVISCGKAAMDVWFARCGADLSPASLSVLRQLLIDSMGLLGSGFDSCPPPTAPSHRSALTWPSLYRLGKFSYRHRWLVISLWLAVMVAVGGAAAAFHGTMSNNFQIPGTETQQMADKLKKELPNASGGSASIVFEATGRPASARPARTRSPPR